MKSARTLAFAALAVLVLGFVTTASASGAYFQATEYPAEVKAEREGEVHILTVEGGISVKCETDSFTAELPEPLETLEVAPKYEKCTALGAAATVAMEGCKYRLDANAADVDIVCPAGKAIKIAAFTCEVQIGSQNGVEKDEYVNHEASPGTVSVNFKAEKIKYNKTKDGFLCPLSGLGEKSDGTYAGNFLAKAYAGAQVGFFQKAAVPTKLCAEAADKCPEGQTYPSTSFAGSTTAGELILHYSDGTNAVIECSKYKLYGSTAVPEGAPQLPTSVNAADFETCAFTAGYKGSCSVKTSLSGGQLLAIGNHKDGRWQFGPTTFTISGCDEPKLSKCEYQEIRPAFTLRGGNSEAPATIEVNRDFNFLKANQGDSCGKSVTWKVTYVIGNEGGTGNLFVTH
jgi:hypothetical protein